MRVLSLAAVLLVSACSPAFDGTVPSAWNVERARMGGTVVLHDGQIFVDGAYVQDSAPVLVNGIWAMPEIQASLSDRQRAIKA